MMKHCSPATRIRAAAGVALLAAAALLASCGGGGSTSGLPSTVAGAWSASTQVAGASLGLVLTEQDSVVAGAGAYQASAGPSGTLTVAGVHLAARVTLQLSYDNGTKATYSATLQDATHMSGDFAFDGGSSSTVVFVRQ
ncbi:hypothetical protein [Ideonella sp.]|uniref:hypothetical protein n=1 Tax=Ideonella sp. TaxID=1929293 RepID=UPI002B46EC6A|nr:hypothetical protein [Ideonella sp.]HJV71289.1 hypothetical protein [Ideonella sp.]